jgi:hypothetical protein
MGCVYPKPPFKTHTSLADKPDLQQMFAADKDRWERAAELIVSWGIVRDELRGQDFLPAEDKDISDASVEESEVLEQRRASEAEKLLSRMPQELADMHKGLANGSEEALLRGVPFAVINSNDHTGGVVGEFWAADVPQHDVSRRWIVYSKPTKAHGIDYFVSHAWDDDGDSKGMGGAPTFSNPEAMKEFGWRKSVAIQNVVRTIKENLKACSSSASTEKSSNELQFWVDKACIPQFDTELKVACITRLEFFIHNSTGIFNCCSRGMACFVCF